MPGERPKKVAGTKPAPNRKGNPPFNISDWGGDRLREDARWNYGAPPVGNANCGWLQHILRHLSPNGTAGVVLANGSVPSAQSGEDAIRKAMVDYQDAPSFCKAAVLDETKGHHLVLTPGRYVGVADLESAGVSTEVASDG